MKRMEAHMANLSRNTNVRPMTRPMTGPRIQCRNCGRMGHMERECFRNQTCKRCNKKGHTERVCRENIQQVNYLDNYDYQEYEYDGYYAENNDYPEEEQKLQARNTGRGEAVGSRPQLHVHRNERRQCPTQCETRYSGDCDSRGFSLQRKVPHHQHLSHDQS